MNTPMDATEAQINQLVDGQPLSTVHAGEKFPALYVHPDTPVYKLAKGLALMGLALFHDDSGRLTIAETWRIAEIRNPRPPCVDDAARQRMLDAGVTEQ